MLSSLNHRNTTNLKELYLRLPTLIQPHMEHLSKYVLQHLDCFKLETISGINLERWCENAHSNQSAMLEFVATCPLSKPSLSKNITAEVQQHAAQIRIYYDFYGKL